MFPCANSPIENIHLRFPLRLGVFAREPALVFTQTRQNAKEIKIEMLLEYEQHADLTYFRPNPTRPMYIFGDRSSHSTIDPEVQ